MSICHAKLCYKIETKKGTISSMRIISQKEISCFEGTGLNGLCPEESFVFDREQDFRGREGINLLVHACHSMLSVFSLFLIPLFFSILFFFFYPFSVLVYMLWFSPRGYYYCDPSSGYARQRSFIKCLPWLAFTIQPLTTFVWSRCPCRPPLIY